MKPMLIRQANGGMRSIHLAANIVAQYASYCGSSKKWFIVQDTPIQTDITAAESSIQLTDLISITVRILNPELPEFSIFPITPVYV